MVGTLISTDPFNHYRKPYRIIARRPGADNLLALVPASAVGAARANSENEARINETNANFILMLGANGGWRVLDTGVLPLKLFIHIDQGTISVRELYCYFFSGGSPFPLVHYGPTNQDYLTPTSVVDLTPRLGLLSLWDGTLTQLTSAPGLRRRHSALRRAPPRLSRAPGLAPPRIRVSPALDPRGAHVLSYLGCFLPQRHAYLHPRPVPAARLLVSRPLPRAHVPAHGVAPPRRSLCPALVTALLLRRHNELHLSSSLSVDAGVRAPGCAFNSTLAR
ncbi:hypothetical protein FB451DRAFT_1174988 [Mycena latifolia]|nr:hypothetical protein FB451DRAFT_1174988 [Mycena latifolia]